MGPAASVDAEQPTEIETKQKLNKQKSLTFIPMSPQISPLAGPSSNTELTVKSVHDVS